MVIAVGKKSKDDWPQRDSPFLEGKLVSAMIVLAMCDENNIDGCYWSEGEQAKRICFPICLSFAALYYLESYDDARCVSVFSPKTCRSRQSTETNFSLYSSSKKAHASYMVLLFAQHPLMKITYVG